MFASLRSRLLVSYILLIVLSLAVAAVALVYLLQGYHNKLALARLDDVAIPMIAQIREMALRGRSPQEVLAYLADQAEELGVRILLVNGEGRVVRDTAHSGSLEGLRLRIPNSRLSANPRQLYRGKYTDPNGRTFVFGAISTTGILSNERLQAGVAAVVIAQPEAGIGSALRDLLPSLLLSAALALIAALVSGFFLTRSILRPVAKLAEASKEIAKGRYNQRVPMIGPSEFKHLSETFNAMAGEVEHSRQLMRDFLANVAHELRTPLTSIRGFVQAQLDGTVGDEAGRQKSLLIVDGEAARLQRLVAELLDLARLEARQVSIAQEPIKLAELADQCVEIFALRAQEKQVKLVADVPPELSVLGDFDRLEQVFANLIDNALKHTPAGGEIVLRASCGADGAIRLSVVDNGPGIDANNLSRLFERFYVGDSGSPRSAGLGLPIAREIVRAHGGDITVESTRGTGTRFVVTLPAA